MRERVYYGIATLILLGIEVFIALNINDNFIRPYVGDMLVVIVVYTFLRMFIPEKPKQLSLYVFFFAVGVEILQYFEIVRILGLEGNTFFRVLIGAVFDVKDIVCYGVGCVVLVACEVFRNKKAYELS